MDNRQRKRRSHVPSRSESVKLPKSRCLGKKFLSIMDTLPMDKKNAISDMGFGGLLQLGCKELHYELITWIMSKSRGAWLPKYTPMAIMAMSRLYREANLLHIMMDIHTRRTIEARLSRNSEHLMSLASSVAQDIATLHARSDGGQSGCALTPPKKSDDGPCIDHDTFPPSQKSAELQSLKGVQMGVQEGCGSKQPSPTPRRRFKHTTKRLVKPAAICKSPFVSQCVQLFPKISQQERLVADYVFEILCDMHDTYITRDELSSFNGGRWVNSVLFFPVCDNNHWHVHVVNIPASRVEILSSLPLRRDNGISVVSRHLSDAIDKAFHAHACATPNCATTKWVDYFNRYYFTYDCGMFAIKYMEHWNGATLAHSITKDKMHLYRLRLVVTLVTNAANNARDKVLKACRI
ncbi:hypothetical protein AAG906_003322 [Vitis piasezkii]